MATNILYDRVLAALRYLFEYNANWHCYELYPRGSECLVFIPTTTTQVATTTGGTVFRYTVLIDLHTAIRSELALKHVSQMTADIVRILNDNTHYRDTNDLEHYYDGVVESIEYDWTDENEWMARITWSCSHEEVT